MKSAAEAGVNTYMRAECHSKSRKSNLPRWCYAAESPSSAGQSWGLLCGDQDAAKEEVCDNVASW
jgi:hypothetical protein